MCFCFSGDLIYDMIICGAVFFYLGRFESGVHVCILLLMPFRAGDLAFLGACTRKEKRHIQLQIVCCSLSLFYHSFFYSFYIFYSQVCDGGNAWCLTSKSGSGSAASMLVALFLHC